MRQRTHTVKTPYSAQAHRQLVKTLNELTNWILSEGVSQTTYAYGENVTARQRGIKHFSKDTPVEVIDSVFKGFLDQYTVPASVQGKINEFRNAFATREEGKQTTLPQADHNTYFDNVIRFRRKVDAIIGDTANMDITAGERVRKQGDTVKEKVFSKAKELLLTVSPHLSDEDFVIQFTDGLLRAIESDNVPAFMEKNKVALGGPVKAVTLKAEIAAPAEELKNLLTSSSSKFQAKQAMQEVYKLYAQHLNNSQTVG